VNRADCRPIDRIPDRQLHNLPIVALRCSSLKQALVLAYRRKKEFRLPPGLASAFAMRSIKFSTRTLNVRRLLVHGLIHHRKRV